MNWFQPIGIAMSGQNFEEKHGVWHLPHLFSWGWPFRVNNRYLSWPLDLWRAVCVASDMFGSMRGMGRQQPKEPRVLRNSTEVANLSKLGSVNPDIVDLSPKPHLRV